MKDSLKINEKQIKRKFPNRPYLSSEIYLNDNNSNTKGNNFYAIQEDEHQQKCWSFAKYKTEYAYPITKEKKCKKKDRGKRIEDPCPCQLFSYACPCTDKKSLTELAKSSKALTVADQVTSTTYFLRDESMHNNEHKIRNVKNTFDYENKMISAHLTDLSEKCEIIIENLKPSNQTNDTQYKPSVVANTCTKNSTNIKSKHKKKLKRIICPHCKEKLDILSTTEDECSIKSKNSPLSRNSCPESHQENESYNIIKEENTDICNHNPPCELVPVCQILPNDNGFVNTQYVENVTATKCNQKMIRVTKACRHHPPCTVVPSCQRINVLKNNCEYIPPCLHRPRCVNLPLCVPFSKKIYNDELLQKQAFDKGRVEHTSNPHYKYIGEHQHDSLNNRTEKQLHGTQNTCEYFSEYSPRFILNPKLPCASPTLSPFHAPTQIPCKCCRSSKSCQYDCLDCKCDTLEESACVKTVVYVRDVGCQFKNNYLYPMNSLLYPKDSSTSLDLNKNTSRFYTNFHTLRYEDKYTNPISGEELSMSTFTSSLEIDDQCPSHGKQAYKKRTTGFNANSRTPFITAFATNTDPIFTYELSSISDEVRRASSRSDTNKTRTRRNTGSVNSRRSFLKGKYKNVFSVRRRRKSRVCLNVLPSSRKTNNY
ncbi:unnamed protein product, partial [Brenthis ino]